MHGNVENHSRGKCDSEGFVLFDHTPLTHLSWWKNYRFHLERLYDCNEKGNVSALGNNQVHGWWGSIGKLLTLSYSCSPAKLLTLSYSCSPATKVFIEFLTKWRTQITHLSKTFGNKTVYKFASRWCLRIRCSRSRSKSIFHTWSTTLKSNVECFVWFLRKN